MKTAELLAYLTQHGIECWECDGRIIAVSAVLGPHQGEMLDTLAILDSYQAARRWLGY